MENQKKKLSLQEEQKALVDSQHSTLLLLSICVNSLATLSSSSSSLSPSRLDSESIQLSHKTKTPPHLALLKLLHSRAASVASFHKALRSFTDNNSNYSWKHSNATISETPATLTDLRLVEDNANSVKQQLGYRQFVSDVLFELSKPFVQRLRKAIEAFSSSKSLTRSIEQAIKSYTSEKGYFFLA